MGSRTWNKGRRLLAGLLAAVMLAGIPGMPARAAEAARGGTGRNDTELKLWYDEPSSQTGTPGAMGDYGPGTIGNIWQQDTLPIGNGTIGANIFGEIGTECVSLNEQTLWNGGPSEGRPNYVGGNRASAAGNGAAIREIQDTFRQGGTPTGAQLNKLLGEGDNLGNGYGYFQPWGNLNIATDGLSDTSAVTGYQRWLSLDNALAGVEFTSGGKRYTREYLTSHPDRVLAAKLTADQSATFTITLPGRMDGSNNVHQAVAVDGDTLSLCGQLIDNQLKYASFLTAVPGNAATSVSAQGDHITVIGTEVVLIFFAATDYAQDYPVYRTGETDSELAERVRKVVKVAVEKGYDAIKADHLTDYHSLYERMTLDLGQTATDKTTDVLLNAYNKRSGAPSITEGERRLLEVMLFQYGRYLTISSSRADSQLPSNLQGIWNYHGDNNAPWHSDFHLNVNLQMNYWPTYSTNLAECADPLMRYMDSLREPGRVTAAAYAGIESTPENPENGFMAHTQNTPYGWTCPGSAFNWGWSPAAVPWMLQNCWEYYEYTGDLNYMKTKIYPMLREEAVFYSQFVTDISGYPGYPSVEPIYATVPAYSPEHGPTTAGNTYEQSLVWQLFEDACTAAELLGVDEDLAEDWRYKQEHLLGPIEIGSGGQIKEWYGAVEDDISKAPDGTQLGQGYGHRHLSHMLGLFPGDLVQRKEEWFNAARVSMENRTDESTGWGMGQRINTWARLRDGNKAYKLIGDLFKGGMYLNLWDAHAPFQIDGNFGYTAGVTEMFMQSNMGFIDLLPALPDVWTDGSAEGIVTRGNFELDLAWADNTLTQADLLSRNGGECVVAYPGLSGAKVTDSQGNLIQVEVLSEDKISFQTAKGQTYHITEIPAAGAEAEDLRAYRADDETVALFWSAEAGKQYQVYRRIEGGELLPVGSPVSGGTYQDTTAYASMGEMTYFVAEAGSTPKTGVTAADMRNQIIDEKDTRIQYSGGWGNWSDSAHYGGSIKFLENPNGTETITFAFYGTGLQVIAPVNPDRGFLAVSVDGGTEQDFDTYAPSGAAQRTVGTIDGLSRGEHTVTVRAANRKQTASSKTKVEFDAFKVLDGGVAPASITVSSGGITRLTKVGATLQMTASDPNVTWSVSGTAATISEDGLLTAGTASGTVTVTATSRADSSVTGTMQITVALPGSETFNVLGYNGSANDNLKITDNNSTESNKRITYAPENAWYIWNESGTFTGKKAETSSGGTSFSYSFTVPEGKTATLEFYAQVAKAGSNGGSLQFALDGTDKGTGSQVHPDIEGSSKTQVNFYTMSDVPAGSHTLTATRTEGKVNLDYIKATFSEVVPDRSTLVALIQECAALKEENCTASSWSAFQAALTAAQGVVNADSATAAALAAQVNALTVAKNELAGVSLTAPQNISALLTEGSAITLKWDAVVGAESYDVTVDGKTVHTTDTLCRVEGLEPGRSYTFTVTAKNTSQNKSATYTAETLDTEAPTKATDLSWDGAGTLSWTAATDNRAVTGYRVLVDGSEHSVVAATSVTLSLDNAQHTVQVIALDGAGNASLPATLVIAPQYTLTVTNAAVSGGRSQFKAGEAVTLTADVPWGHILSSWESEEIDLTGETRPVLSFSMPAEDVSVTAHVEEKNWPVTARLTNLESDLERGATVGHGETLTLTLTASAPYRLPEYVTVTVGGEELGTSLYTYSAATGRITVPEVKGEVVITAENAPQVPNGVAFTAADPFTLPSAVGDSAKAQFEYLSVTGATVTNGPGFQNKHVNSFVSGNTATLYYNAPKAGTYTMTLHYRSARNPGNQHTLTWSGAGFETRTEPLPGTLDAAGNASYESQEYRLVLDEAGAGTIAFSTASTGVGVDLDWVSFRLDALPVVTITGIELEPAEATLYTNEDDPDHKVSLTALLTPEGVDESVLQWSSSDPDVAYVEQDGTVTARGKNGLATITVTAGEGSDVEATAAITVKTKVTGSVSIDGAKVFGEPLVASINQISHQEAKDTLRYQWKRDGEPIEGETGNTYTPTVEDLAEGTTVTVTVTAADPYVGERTADPVTIGKAPGPDVIATLDSEDCTTADNDDGRIFGLNPQRIYEWKKTGEGEDAWVALAPGTTEIPGLTPDSYHLRVKETGTHTAGAASRTLTILAFDAVGYEIGIDDTMENGVVRASVRKQEAGQEVALMVYPAEGYELVPGSLKVTKAEDDTVEEPLDENGRFTMPTYDVFVTAGFQIKTYTIDHQLSNIHCSMADHDHTVEYGDMPVIELEPDEGYILPQTVTVTTATGIPYSGYTYREGVITFTQGITEVLVIEGDGVRKSYQVFYTISGLTAIGQPRGVNDGEALQIVLTAAPGYSLPEEIALTMDGAAFSDYTYDEVMGVIDIAAGKITGDLAVEAHGVSGATPLTGVSVEGKPSVGELLTAQVLPAEAGPTARYQWLRVEGAAETDIPGAVNPRYMLTSDDEGATIRVRVVGVTPYGGTVTSQAVGPVMAANVVPTTGVSLKNSQESVVLGGSVTLVAAVEPANATNKALLWASGDEGIATVDAYGVVTGRAPGTAVITVTTVNGGHTATCLVTVERAGVSLDRDTASLEVGKTLTLNALIAGELTDRSLRWSSDNESVARVDANGVVTGVSAGTAVITVTTVEGGYTASCRVTVTGGSTQPSGGGGGSSSGGKKPVGVTNEDGSVTTTVKDGATGTVTATTKWPDGKEEVLVTRKDGSSLQTITEPTGKKVEKEITAEKDVTITVTDSEGERLARVELPAEIPAPAERFVDVPRDHWAEKSIQMVAGLGLVKGVGEERYDMTASMTRASLATILYRLSNGTPSGKLEFADVDKESWYADGVAWAAGTGVVQGIEGNGQRLFWPNDVITREQLAVMLCRYAGVLGMNVTGREEALKGFHDSGRTGAWAVNGVAWCVEKGILRGKGGDILDPTAEVSRAETAVMLERFIELLR